jgi:hypothetical protein
MSKRSTAIAIMTEFAGEPAASVIAKIALANEIDEKAAKSYYAWIVKNERAPGETGGKAKANSAPSPKAVKATVKRMAAEVIAKAKPKSKEVKAESLLPDSEIAKIKAANLARLKAVSTRKVYTNVARPEGPGVDGFDADTARAEVETLMADDSFVAPRFLSKAQVKALV